jgi:hypothetical protein
MFSKAETRFARLPRPLVIRCIVAAAILTFLLHLLVSFQGEIRHYRPKWDWDSISQSTHNDTSQQEDTSLSQQKDSSQSQHSENSDQKAQYDQRCGTFPATHKVAITVKTGATEAHKKIPTIMSTSLNCAPNVFIFSDMEEDVGQWTIYDSFESTSSSMKNEHEDFDLYRKQQELKKEGLNVSSSLEDKGDAAWALDKYKNLHIVEMTWNLDPSMDWYFHVDADTYVFWPTLMAWLETLDPSEVSYIGSVAAIMDLPFAHGGSGILLSREATRVLVDDHRDVVEKWDSTVEHECCGDFGLARALGACDIEVVDVAPSLNGGSIPGIWFGPGNNWCHPLVTLHHIDPKEAERLGAFEAQRANRSVSTSTEQIFIQLQRDLNTHYITSRHHSSTPNSSSI